MIEILRDFLIDVAVDPARAYRFAADPAAEIGELDLTAEERAALLARDSARLRLALDAPRKGATAQMGIKKKAPKKGPKKKPVVKKTRRALARRH